MIPTIGRIVYYQTTKQDRILLNDNKCRVQKQLPALIVAVYGSETEVNLQVFIDGPIGFLWKSEIKQGNNEGQWLWPDIK